MTLHARRLLLASTFVVLALAAIVLVASRLPTTEAWAFAGFGGAVAAAVGVWLASARRRPASVVVFGARPMPAAERPRAAHPYRGAPPPSPRRLAGISSRAAALVLLASMAAAAIVLPLATHRPPWIEIEIVLAAWWAAWVVVLAVVARVGVARARDALVVRLPWSRRPRAKESFEIGLSVLDGASSLDLEGLLFVVLLGLAFGFALLGAWLVVDVAVPILVFAASAAVLRAGRDAGRSSTRASVAALGWATGLVAPAALFVWLAHVFVHARAV